MRIVAGFVLALVFVICAAVVALSRIPVPLDAWFSDPVASFELAQGENPSPVKLVRPDPQPYSAMALLGRAIFFDKTLSSSGKLNCASCHDPQNFYGPDGDLPAVYGGPNMTSQGVRAVPSLMYLDQSPAFTVGPDPAIDGDDPTPLPQLAARSLTAARVTKTAQDHAQSAVNIVPSGGLFWDGRANTLQAQAAFPLLSPIEMDGGTMQTVAAKMQASPYADQLKALFGDDIFSNPGVLVNEAMFAVGRYEVEDPDFHRYTSKYDYWLEGKARFTPAELRGYVLFNDPAKGDCAACHIAQPTPDGQPPLFTDHQFEALGAPRNPKLTANDDASYYDMGICGPYRTDFANQTQFCGMFLTPTLRNSATRKTFFHNGVYHDLRSVVDFYVLRDVQPDKIYPVGADGKVQKFNDLPQKYWANIDNTDPPLDRKLGDKPALTPSEEEDIVAYIKTLTDGYTPSQPKG